MTEIRDRINARRSAHGRHLPTVTLAQADKSPNSVLAAADALALVAASWLKSNCSTNAENFRYRTYVETEAAISWFCSLEHGVLTTRRVRYSELQSLRAGAASIPLASPHASASEQLLSTRPRAPKSLPKELVSTLDSLAAHLHCEPARLLRLADDVDKGDCYTTQNVRISPETLRSVISPSPYFGTVSKELSRLLVGTTNYEAPTHVFGFVRGRGIRDNAREHLNQDCVLRLDLQQFFESIDRSRVENALVADGVAPDVASVIGKLAAPRGCLGAGLSTSPHLSNLVFQDTGRCSRRAQRRARAHIHQIR